ncbi:hypothetical protein SAMN02927900_05806 [Rhizobium mongolense subsp. loessense]|uniref:Uncharacterized protein n=1 Tax=Rhizobium mongolense subsp. loessense TaxID=158890 RepID=A0A1G4TXU6_9HYPH|nr:hypothetical protein SAMN02927900_05806 [Rhizobium mongolense subsp. loessense]
MTGKSDVGMKLTVGRVSVVLQDYINRTYAGGRRWHRLAKMSTSRAGRSVETKLVA